MAFDKAALYDATRAALSDVISTDGSVTPLNEAETRTHVVDPVLSALDYRTLDHVRREYRLPASGQFVDYRLKAGEQDIVVEAKLLGAELGPKEASQLVGYCATEGIRWALLTNGLRWQVFDIEVSGDWEAKRISDINLEAAYRNEALAEALEPLAHFARETLLLDDSDLRAWAHEERVRRHLHELVSNPASPVIVAVVTEMTRVGIEPSPTILSPSCAGERPLRPKTKHGRERKRCRRLPEQVRGSRPTTFSRPLTRRASVHRSTWRHGCRLDSGASESPPPTVRASQQATSVASTPRPSEWSRVHASQVPPRSA